MKPMPLNPDQLRVPFHGLLEAAAAHRGEELALLHGADRYTFRDLDERSSAFAHALRERGIGAGDRVGLYAFNRPEWILALFGVLKTGASLVPISPAWKRTELEHAVALTRPREIIADAELAPVVDGIGGLDGRIAFDQPPGREWVAFDELLEGQPCEALELQIDPETCEALLPFSSGTTGLPKAVRHTHRSLVAGAHQWKLALGMSEQDCLHTYSPLSHILGAANLGAGIASGARHRLFRRFDVDALLQSIEHDGITIGIAVAPVAMALANHPELESYDLSSLRFFDWCATPVVPEVAERFTRRTGVRWHTAYGATEAPVLSANPVDDPSRWRLDSPGLPAAGMRLRIVDLETREPLAAGEIGEVVAHGPNLMQGYLPEEANADAFLEGGWYRTGDVGWIEPEGWIHLTDRVKEMIKVSGFQVAPAELESVLLGHPDVLDCAVFGVPDAARGHLPRAAVVTRAGAELDASALIDFAGEKLANYKRLSGVDFVIEIPRTPSGKALRRVLSERHEQGLL
jgi:acyl-CoA synthetase (AMP-forming)/AMP-acid ligase II